VIDDVQLNKTDYIKYTSYKMLTSLL